jgi:hypothetical protein
VARQAGLAVDLQDFLGSAAAVGGKRFTVDYNLGPAGRSRVAQRPPQRRVDVISADGRVTRFIVTGNASYSCRQSGGAWTCAAASAAPSIGLFTPEAIEAAVKGFTDNAAAFTFALEPRTIAGSPARCLVVTPKSGSQVPEVLCISPEGVPLQITSGGQTVAALAYLPDAAGSDFALPAKPTA